MYTHHHEGKSTEETSVLNSQDPQSTSPNSRLEHLDKDPLYTFSYRHTKITITYREMYIWECH